MFNITDHFLCPMNPLCSRNICVKIKEFENHARITNRGICHFSNLPPVKFIISNRRKHTKVTNRGTCHFSNMGAGQLEKMLLYNANLSRFVQVGNHLLCQVYHI